MARELVLGLELVLPDGTVMTSLNKMLKNNAGYDLRQLFIGSEGTLGIVTRAVLRLFPQPASVSAAPCGLGSYAEVPWSRQSLLSLLETFASLVGCITQMGASHGAAAPNQCNGSSPLV